LGMSRMSIDVQVVQRGMVVLDYDRKDWEVFS
jgi:hypothetical protein